TANCAVVRYLPNGQLDPGFGGGDGIVIRDVLHARTNGGKVLLQPDGKILQICDIPAWDFGIVRYNPDGSEDTSFGVNGVASTSFSDLFEGLSAAIGVQSDGRLIVSGVSWSGQGP